jgi:hypothetical protein
MHRESDEVDPLVEHDEEIDPIHPNRSTDPAPVKWRRWP